MAARLSALRAGHFLPPGRFLVLICVRGWVDHRAIVRLKGLGTLKKSTSSGTRSGDLPACIIVPQPTTLPRAPLISYMHSFSPPLVPHAPPISSSAYIRNKCFLECHVCVCVCACASLYISMYVYVRLATDLTVGCILFIFGIYEFIHHRSAPDGTTILKIMVLEMGPKT
jgi:hypothetical protein